MVMSLVLRPFCTAIFDDEKRAVSNEETALNEYRN